MHSAGCRGRVRCHVQTATVDRRGIEGHHHRDVMVDETVRRGVLVRREPGTARMLVVHLLFVENCGSPIKAPTASITTPLQMNDRSVGS